MARPPLKKSTSRLSITLDDEYIALLDQFSDVSGTPRSTLVRQLLESLLPTVEGLIEVYKLSEHDKSQAMKRAQQLIGESLLSLNQRQLFDD